MVGDLNDFKAEIEHKPNCENGAEIREVWDWGQ